MPEFIARWQQKFENAAAKAVGAPGRKHPIDGRGRSFWCLAAWLGVTACCGPASMPAQGSFFPKGTNVTSLVVISDGNLTNSAQKVLIATLQGLVARQSARQIYIDGGSGYSIWDGHLNTAYGIPLTTETSPWTLLSEFQGLVGGYILYDFSANTNSLDAATSLCGPLNAVAVDASIESTVRSCGITNLIADVSAASDQFVWTNGVPNYNSLLSHSVVAEQKQSFADNLRDYAVMANAFVFYEGDDAFRSTVMSGMNPDSLGLGWGADEAGSISDSSSHGVFTCASDWALDLSTLSSVRDLSLFQHTYSHPVSETNVHYVTFVVTDGDNVQWNLGGLPAYFDSPARGSFNMGWALSPPAADFFVAGPSGIGYFYPSMYPDLGLQVRKLNDFMTRADLNISQILDFNSFYRLDLWNQYLAQPAIDALFYLEYSPYNGAQGAMQWSANGKPVVAVRDLLWAGIEEETNLITNLNGYPRDPSCPEGYTLVAVHVWSKNLTNVQQVVTNLAPNVRVVTPDMFVRLIRNNVGRRLFYDFANGLQGWVASNVVTTSSGTLGPANPGFEQGGADWNAGGAGGASGSVNFYNSPTNGPSAPGGNCVSETSDGTGNTDFRANYFSLGTAAAGANPVTFSFDYSILNPVTSGNNVRVGLRFFDITGNNFQGENNSHVGSDNGDVGAIGWQPFSVTVTPPATAYTADIRVSMNIFGDDDWNDGAVLFDNFSVSAGLVAQSAEWTGTAGNPPCALALDGSGYTNAVANPGFSRQIILPVNATTLSFNTMAGNDGLLRVRLQGSDGAIATLLDWSGLTNHNVWVTNTVSLADYAGQTVTLYFDQANGGLGIDEQRFVDDVSILAAGPGWYVPAAPKLLPGTSTNGVVNLLWRDNDNNESGFKVERSAGTNGAWNEIASLSSNVTTYADSAVVPGVTYSYGVSSWNAAGSNTVLNICTVTVAGSAQGACRLNVPVLAGHGNFRLAFLGAPLNNYALEWTEDLTPPVNWFPQMTNCADAAGLLVFTNLQSAKAGFWRTRYVP
jgi:hypothetical protein